MGQRSQIYVGFTGKNGNKKLIARYFPWNYGERMVSRARWTMEWAKEHRHYLGSHANYVKRLIAVLNANWDLHDVQTSSDLIAERNEQFPDVELNEYVFGSQNCNDGKLFIDLTGNQLKYAFGDREGSVASIMDAEAYMAWDYHRADWRAAGGLTDEDLKDYDANVRWLQENAVLMTPEELVEFKSYPYGCEPILPTTTLPNHHIDKLTAMAVSNAGITKERRDEILNLLGRAQKIFWNRSESLDAEAKDDTEWFGVVRWCEEDLRGKLKEMGFAESDNNVSELWSACQHHSFTGVMIAAGWDSIEGHIDELDRRGLLEMATDE